MEEMEEKSSMEVYNVTNYKRTDRELQEFLILCICVAGKTAYIQEKKVRGFLAYLDNITPGKFPLDAMKTAGAHHVGNALQSVRMGQYKRIQKALMHLANNYTGKQLRGISFDQLSTVPGVGQKTARFFILHSRPDAECAVLDTHILKFMSSKGIKVPNVTPGSRLLYEQLEKEFIKLFKAQHKHATLAEFDFAIWKGYAR